MNQPMFEQDIIQTLELCLSKMSKKLKSSFDPYDKLSIQLLKQFRSTISTYHTCLKQVGKVLESISKTGKPHNKAQNESISKHEPIANLSHPKQNIMISDNKITRLLNRHKYNLPNDSPSGLLMNPG